MTENFSYYDFLTASVLVLNIFVALLFFIRNYKINRTYKLIGICLLLLLIRSFLVHLNVSGNLIHFPHLLLLSHVVSRLGLPLLFLTLFYETYQTKFRWYDLFHFTPAVLFFLNYWNLFVQSAEYKVELIQKMSVYGYDIVWQQGSYLSEEFVYLVRVVPLIVYLIAILVLFVRNKNKQISPELKQFSQLVFVFLVINAIPLIFTHVFPILKRSDVLQMAMIGYISDLIFLICLFFVPSLLYKPYFSILNSDSIDMDKDEEFYQENMARLQVIEDYFNQYHPFLDPEYSVSKLEKQVKIPARLISKAIKAGRDQNFNQFLNEYRINYLLNNIKVEEAIKTPFNQLSYQIGFNSVNNFYSYFKSCVGCTPKVYYEQLKMNNSVVRLRLDLSGNS